MPSPAREMVDKILANVAAWLDNQITDEEFAAISKRLWDEATEAGIDEEVLEIVVPKRRR